MSAATGAPPVKLSNRASRPLSAARPGATKRHQYLGGSSMRLCRYDDDRLGVVIGDQVHDVTPAQDEIRRAARYDMFGDAVIAALPEWRGRLEEMAKKAPGKPLAQVKLLPPVARPSKVMAAPTNP